MADLGPEVREYFTKRLHDFTLAKYRAYIDKTDPNGDQFPVNQELSPKAVRIDRNELADELSSEVKLAFDYYFKKVEKADWGSVRVYRVATPKIETHVVRVTTDGDDGWIEVYSTKGDFLAAGRTYIELIAWAPREEVREQFHDKWPASLDRSATLWKPFNS